MIDKKLGWLRQFLETARADRKPAVGPIVADRDQRNRHRLRASPGGGFRHHGNADTGCDHAADRVEIPQPRPNLQPNPEPRGMPADMDGERGRVGQSDEVAIRNLDKIDLATAREFAAFRRNQHQPVFAKGKSLEMRR